jgi:hypothetical protein
MQYSPAHRLCSRQKRKLRGRAARPAAPKNPRPPSARGTSRQAHNRSPERGAAPSLRTSLPQTTRRDRERDALEGDSLGFEWPETIPGNAIHEVGAQRNFNARGSKNANEQAECCREKTFAAEHDGGGCDENTGGGDDQLDAQALQQKRQQGCCFQDQISRPRRKTT